MGTQAGHLAAKQAAGKLDTCAWPGGYPIFYLVADNGVLCPKCANEHGHDLSAECPDDDQWRVVAADINWEDPQLTCEHCSERIPSAYADDE